MNKNMYWGLLIFIIVALVFLGVLKSNIVFETKIDKGVKSELYNDLVANYGLKTILDMTDRKILFNKYNSNQEVLNHFNLVVEEEKNHYSDFNNYIKNQGFINEDDWLNEFKYNYYKELAIKDYIYKNISEEEIEFYYSQHRLGDIKANHILIKIPEGDNQSEIEQAIYDRAVYIIGQLESGRNFDELARLYSQDELTKDNGGQLGYFKLGEKDINIEKALINMNNNQYSDVPVKSKLGYHILWKIDQKENIKSDSTNEYIKELICLDKVKTNDSIKALIELRKEYRFKINDRKLKQDYENYIKEIENSD